MPGSARFPASPAIRDFPNDPDGPLHPEDIAAIRHGGFPALIRRRLQDRAVVIEGHLTAALDASRALRRRLGRRAAHGGQKRLMELRASALESWAEARDASPRD